MSADAAAARAQHAVGRVAFLDVARGIAVVAMLVANLVNVFVPVRPHWLGHNLGDELLPLDLPAPLFQFIVGCSLVLFLARRGQAAGRTAARWMAARRFLALIALGLVLDAVWTWRFEWHWGVLQTLGVGGLVATLLADADDIPILACAAAIVAVHYGPGNNAVHRSFTDCLPFVPLTLLGYVAARPLAPPDPAAAAHARTETQRRLAVIGVVCIALALALRMWGIPFNKVTGSSSFVAFTAGASATIVALLATIEARGLRFWPPLVALGAHALTAWVLQYLLVFYPVALLVRRDVVMPEAAGLMLVAALVVGLAMATNALARRGIRVPL